MQRMVITQGQQAISSNPEVVMSTLLGSCVAVCLWDQSSGVGGMNHILLAHQKRGHTQCDASGINAMELLINGVVKQGGARDRLVAKVFGGARMVDGLSKIGQTNADFVLEFLQREGFPINGQALGGTSARQLLFWPVSGLVKLKTVSGVVPVEADPSPLNSGNGLELF